MNNVFSPFSSNVNRVVNPSTKVPGALLGGEPAGPFDPADITGLVMRVMDVEPYYTAIGAINYLRDASGHNNHALASVPCITGNGTTVWVNLDTSIPSLTDDFSIEMWLKVDNTGKANGLCGHWNGTSGWVLLLLSGGTTLRVYRNASFVTVTVAIVAGTWYRLRVDYVGTTCNVTVDGATQSKSGTFAATNTSPAGLTPALMSYAGQSASNPLQGSISDFVVTSGSTVITVPLQDGPGSSNTNRNLAYCVNDGTGGVVSGAVLNGTVATIWGTLVPGQVKDWCSLHGGRIGASGQFIAGLIGEENAADGNIKTLASGKIRGNPFTRVNFNPFNDLTFNSRDVPVATETGDDLNDPISPSNSAFCRIATDGDDRFLIYEDEITGSDLTSILEYIVGGIGLMAIGSGFMVS